MSERAPKSRIPEIIVTTHGHGSLNCVRCHIALLHIQMYPTGTLTTTAELNVKYVHLITMTTNNDVDNPN